MFDALILGAGPAGATVARLLAQAGWSVAVVEKTAFPRAKVCGEFLSAPTLALLDDSPIGAAIRAHAGPAVRRVGLFAGEAAVVTAMPRGVYSGWGHAVRRHVLDPLLLDAAAQQGATVLQPWRATELRRLEHGAQCVIASDRGTAELSARIVIAAGGSWERGPWSSAPDPAHAPSDLIAFKARFTGSTLADDLMPIVLFPGGYGGMVRAGDDVVGLSCCIRRDALAECRTRYPGLSAAAAVVRHIISTCAGVREALACAQPAEVWLAAGPIRPGIRRRYAEGVFSVGNLAGEAHPIIADGIGMAIQAGWLLSGRLIESQDRLSSRAAVAAAGAAYTADWTRSFACRIRAASVFARVAMGPRSLAAGVAVARRIPAVLAWGAWLSGKAAGVRAFRQLPVASGPRLTKTPSSSVKVDSGR